MSGISWSGSRWRLQNGHVTYLLVYPLRPACKQFILIVSNESKLFVLVKTKKEKKDIHDKIDGQSQKLQHDRSFNQEENYY